MKFGKKLMCLLLVFSLVMGQGAFAQGVYQDIEDHWAKSEIEYWSSQGVIEGSNGTFRPAEDITRAEMMVMIDRVMQFNKKAANVYDDLHQTWYTTAVLKNVQAGIVQGYEGKIYPEGKISREEAIVMLGRALNIQEMYGATQFADNGDIASWSLGYVKAFTEKGYVKGRPGNKIDPKATISRGEVVKLMDNVISGLYGTGGNYSEDIDGNVVINTSGVTLSDMTIAGNLIIAEGVGDGEVYLDQVAIKGDVIVKGGGENSIYFNSVTVGGGLVVEKSDGKIRIVASGSTSVKATTLKSGAILVEKALIGGGFETVMVPAEVVGDSKVVLTGNFTELNAFSKDLVVELSSKTVVDIIAVASGAEGFKLSGAGKAGTLKVEANNVTNSVQTDRIEVAKDVQKVVSNGKELAAGSTTSTPSTNNTSNASSSSTSSSGKSSGSSSSGSSSSGGTTTVLASSIAFNYTGNKLILNQNATYQLTATVSPSNTTNKAVSWALLTTSGAATSFIPKGATTTIHVTTGAGTVTNDVISIDQNGLVTARNTTGASTVVVIAQDGSKTVAMLPVEVSATETPTPPVPPAGTVTVTFDTGDYGSKVAAQLLDAGDKITSSKYTDRYGYDFEGWLLNGSAFDIDNTPITASIELVADWSLKTERYSSDPLLVRDDRFAQGYPKMELVNDTWMLKVKLADAAPAKVSMVFSRYMDDTDTTCVLHGHLGYSDSGLDAADYYKTASLSDTDEHVFNTGVETSEHNRLIGSAFVVDQGGSISAQPTVVISPGLITSTLDNVAPEARHAFLSIDKSKIVLDFDEDLDGTTTVDPADFSFTGLDGASVTRAYRNQDEDKFVLEVTGFDNYQEDSGLVFKYTGDDLKDEVGNVVTTKDLEDVELVHFVVPRVTKVALDSNGQGVGTFVSGSTIAFAEVAYYENTRALDVDSISGWRSSDSLEEYSKLDAVFDSNNISNLHVKVDFNGDVMTLLGNVDVIEDTGATEVKVTDPVSFEGASYNTATKELEILLDNNYNDYRVLGCSFTVTVNGSAYQLRGISDHIEMYNDAYNRLLFDLSPEDIQIEIGDNVTVTYQEQHQVDEYTDAFLRNDAYVNPVTIQAIPVQLQ